MTDAETKLWHMLRRDRLMGLHFRRQHPVGPYTLDFYCPVLQLAVEVDGGQHAVNAKQKDERRTRWLAERGIAVCRFWNNDVLRNLEGVLTELASIVEKRAAGLTPSITGGGNGESLATKQQRTIAPTRAGHSS